MNFTLGTLRRAPFDGATRFTARRAARFAVVLALGAAVAGSAGLAAAAGSARPAPSRPAPRGAPAAPAAHAYKTPGPKLAAKAKQPASSVYQTFVVDTSSDSATGTSCASGHPVGTCSLRAAVAAANADTGHVDAITIPSGMTVRLLQGTLDLTNSLQINGTGASVDGQGAARVFNQYGSPAVQITGLTITGGGTTWDGGGIYCANGTLNLVNVVLRGNYAANGGGIYTASDCQLWMDGAVVQDNTATGSLWSLVQAAAPLTAHGNGGGIYTYGSSYIARSTIGDPLGTAGNRAAQGAGIYNYDGNMTVTGSTISGNSSPSTFGYGVGIYNDEVLDLSNSKVDYNTAPYGADGVGLDTEYLAQISNTEISFNTASGTGNVYGGGIYDDGDTTTLANVSLVGNASTLTGGGSVYGGALLSYAYQFSFNGGTVSSTTNGQAGESDFVMGGALYLDGSHATVQNVTISNTHNDSTPNEYPEGGAVYINQYTTLQNVSISGTANAGYDVYGGAIYNDDYATLTGVTITSTSNHAAYSSALAYGGGGYIAGGAIYNDGENMSIDSSSIDGTTNVADAPSPASSEVDGGAIYNDYESAMTDLSITNTKVTASGGAGYVYGGAFYNDESLNAQDMQVIGTTVQADSFVQGGLWYNDDRLNATNFTLGSATVSVLGGPAAGTPYAAGAIMYNDSQASVINGTLDDITSSVPAAGARLWAIENDDLLQLTNTTIANDTIRGPAGSTFLLYGYGPSQLGLRNSVVSSSTAAANCGFDVSPSSILSAGHNLDSGTSCRFTNAGDQSNVDPKVAMLDNNGGLVETGAIKHQSPAVKAATNCPPTDARGVPRPAAVCDAGAYELTKK